MLFGDALVSLPFLVYGGPVANSDEASTVLVEKAAMLAEELGVDYLELRNRRKVTSWPTKDRYVTFKKGISAEPEDNLKGCAEETEGDDSEGDASGARSNGGRRHRPITRCT